MLLTNDFVPLLYLINQCIYFNCMKVLSAVYYQYVHFYGHKTNQLNFLFFFMRIVVKHMFNIEFFETWQNIRLKNQKYITSLGTFDKSILLLIVCKVLHDIITTYKMNSNFLIKEHDACSIEKKLDDFTEIKYCTLLFYTSYK